MDLDVTEVSFPAQLTLCLLEVRIACHGAKVSVLTIYEVLIVRNLEDVTELCI